MTTNTQWPTTDKPLEAKSFGAGGYRPFFFILIILFISGAAAVVVALDVNTPNHYQTTTSTASTRPDEVLINVWGSYFYNTSGAPISYNTDLDGNRYVGNHFYASKTTVPMWDKHIGPALNDLGFASSVATDMHAADGYKHPCVATTHRILTKLLRRTDKRCCWPKCSCLSSLDK
jgi:hypothetical protein